MTITNRKNRKYSIVPYQKTWAQDFFRIEAELKPLFGDLAIAFEHVGSTAVERMSGKATIDVLVIVGSILDVDALNQDMEQLGYTALGDYIKQGGRLFAKEISDERIVNVHCFEFDHDHIQEMIIMRDFLRSHPDELEQYAKLKRNLFAKHPNDYIAYRANKDPYLAQMKARAIKWNAKHCMNSDEKLVTTARFDWNSVGLDFGNWEEEKIWALDLPVQEIDIEKLLWHLDVPYWENDTSERWTVTPRDVIDGKHGTTHERIRTDRADTSFPIDLFEHKGKIFVLDGLHRFIKLFSNQKLPMIIEIMPLQSALEAKKIINRLVRKYL